MRAAPPLAYGAAHRMRRRKRTKSESHRTGAVPDSVELSEECASLTHPRSVSTLPLSFPASVIPFTALGHEALAAQGDPPRSGLHDKAQDSVRHHPAPEQVLQDDSKPPEPSSVEVLPHSQRWRFLSWNVKGQKSWPEISYDWGQWDVACLQELGTNHDIPHLVIQSHTIAGSLSAIVIHPRRVPQLRAWHATEGVHPTAASRMERLFCQ